jgi:hypothetical protein
MSWQGMAYALSAVQIMPVSWNVDKTSVMKLYTQFVLHKTMLAKPPFSHTETIVLT